jgi:hypothetical protein
VSGENVPLVAGIFEQEKTHPAMGKSTARTHAAKPGIGGHVRNENEKKGCLRLWKTSDFLSARRYGRNGSSHLAKPATKPAA